MVSILWKDFGWFLIGLSIFDFSSNWTGVDMQKFSILGISWNGRAIDQERLKSTLKMSYLVENGLTTFGSSMDGFQQVLQFRFFIIFLRSGPAVFGVK